MFDEKTAHVKQSQDWRHNAKEYHEQVPLMTPTGSVPAHGPCQHQGDPERKKHPNYFIVAAFGNKSETYVAMSCDSF